MKPKVMVVMSTYNGSNRIVKQIDSIFAQIGVDVSLYIRDDNSKDDTVEVIQNYINEHPDYNIKYVVGDNMGYAKSFWTALTECDDSEYYAFSDQDDIWFPYKLKKSIDAINICNSHIPQLSYSKMLRCDENLIALDEQVDVIPECLLTKKLVLTQTYNYGAATLINHKAKLLICRCWPNVYDLPHDLWAGLLCFWFGNVHYINEDLYYWIRYSTSVTGEGTKRSGIKHRIRESLKKKSYVNVASFLLSFYDDLLNTDEKAFLSRISNCKKNIFDRFALVLDKEFCRRNRMGTIMLKIGILLGWY